MERTLWFERQFRFDLPPGAFPSVLERLRGTPARLEEKLSGLSVEIRTNRLENAWSIQEHAGHLLDLDELHQLRVEDYLAGKEMLSPADLKNRKTTDANHNARDVSELLRSFRNARIHFVESLRKIEDVTRKAIHPRLNQAMRVIDMAVFVAEHDDHHLATISQLKEKLGVQEY